MMTAPRPRFHLFAGMNYDEGGGIFDYVATFASLDEAKEFDRQMCAAPYYSSGAPLGTQHTWAHIAQDTDEGLRLVARRSGDVWEDVEREAS